MRCPDWSAPALRQRGGAWAAAHAGTGCYSCLLTNPGLWESMQSVAWVLTFQLDTALCRFSDFNISDFVEQDAWDYVGGVPQSSAWHDETRHGIEPAFQNGGLSMHTAMEKSQDSSAAAHCAKLFGYQLYDEVWPQMTALLQSNQNVCVDGHSPVPPDWLRRVRALRNVTTGTDVPPPRVLTTLRIRKPPAQYHSFYEWDQVPRMAHKWATNRSLLEYVGMTPDLQASILLDSGSAEAAQHRHMPTTPLNTSMCDRALATAAGVDLLTTTEAMGEMWPVLRRLTGLALPEETIHEDPKVFGCCGPAGTASLAVDEVEEATRRVAPCDWQLYEMAQQSTQRLLGEWKAL